MARYIDADKLKERLMVGSELDPEPCKGFRSALLAMVDTQEDADVVEVVRCRDCVYWNRDFVVEDINEDEYCQCNNFTRYLRSDCYCAYGERRDDGEH